MGFLVKANPAEKERLGLFSIKGNLMVVPSNAMDITISSDSSSIELPHKIAEGLEILQKAWPSLAKEIIRTSGQIKEPVDTEKA